MPVAANYTPADYQASVPFPEKDREALIEGHLPQVKFIAERLAAKLPPWVDLNDLVGAGMFGLLDAVEKFDPSKGVLFKTYAEMRVRGAILDSLRGLDWAPRSIRKRARDVEAAYRELEGAGGTATEEEVARHLGMRLPELHALLTELRGLTITALEGNDDDEDQAHIGLPDPAETPLARYERQEARERLTEAIDRLTGRERQIVALYYVEELTMKEIGSVIGITESRVSQIHTQAVLRLRSMLGARGASLSFAS